MEDNKLMNVPQNQKDWYYTTFKNLDKKYPNSDIGIDKLEIIYWEAIESNILGINFRLYNYNGDYDLESMFILYYTIGEKQSYNSEYILWQIIEIQCKAIEREFFELAHNCQLIYDLFENSIIKSDEQINNWDNDGSLI